MAISGTFDAADATTRNAGDVGIDVGDADTYVQIETWQTIVDVSGGEVSFVKEDTLGGVSVVGTGNKSAWTVTGTCFYTEGSTDPFQNMWDAYEAGTYDCDVQWSVAQGTSGSYLFTTANGKLTHVSPPTYDSNSTDFKKFMYTIQAPTLARTTVS
jgi:hypothetical protein